MKLGLRLGLEIGDEVEIETGIETETDGDCNSDWILRLTLRMRLRLILIPGRRLRLRRRMIISPPNLTLRGQAGSTHTHPYTTAACAAGVVTKNTDRDSLRYTYNGTRRVRQLALVCESN